MVCNLAVILHLWRYQSGKDKVNTINGTLCCITNSVVLCTMQGTHHSPLPHVVLYLVGTEVPEGTRYWLEKLTLYGMIKICKRYHTLSYGTVQYLVRFSTRYRMEEGTEY